MLLILVNIFYKVYLEKNRTVVFKVICDDFIAVCFIDKVKNLKGLQVRSNCSKGVVGIVCLGCKLSKLVNQRLGRIIPWNIKVGYIRLSLELLEMDIKSTFYIEF